MLMWTIELRMKPWIEIFHNNKWRHIQQYNYLSTLTYDNRIKVPFDS